MYVIMTMYEWINVFNHKHYMHALVSSKEDTVTLIWCFCELKFVRPFQLCSQSVLCLGNITCADVQEVTHPPEAISRSRWYKPCLSEESWWEMAIVKAPCYLFSDTGQRLSQDNADRLTTSKDNKISQSHALPTGHRFPQTSIGTGTFPGANKSPPMV